MESQDVPTDSPLRFRLFPGDQSCLFGGTPAKIQIELVGPGGALVEGGPAEQESPKVSVLSQPFFFEWRPAQPLAPSTQYSLRLKGISGDAVDLVMTTGAGPYQLPAASSPTGELTAVLHDELKACCYRSDGFSCAPTNSCAPVRSRNKAALSLQVNSPGAPGGIRPHLVVNVEQSEAGGDYVPAATLVFQEGEMSSQVGVRFEGQQGPFCARVVYFLKSASQSMTSEPLCFDGAGIDFSEKPGDCGEVAQVVSACSPDPPGTILSFDAEAKQHYQKICPGSPVSAGGGAGVAAVEAPSSGDGEGCQAAAGRGAGVGAAVALAALAAGGLRRRRRR
jgi:MYXO-CTERM domain-containing protein